MFDVIKTLSGLVKTKKGTKAPEQVKEPQKVHPVAPSVDVEASVRIAEAKAKEMIVEAKDEAFKIRREAEDEARRKLEAIDRREGALDERDKHLVTQEGVIQQRLNDAEKGKQEMILKLEKVAHMTRDEGKQLIMDAVRLQLREDIAKEIKEAQSKAEEEADIKSKQILVDAMRHGATDYVPEYTVSVIKITDEEVKGRIIGKEGRNIRAFETATGVDVDLDEEGVIRLSCFDPVRRETARIALERLIRDGRVQPGRIEEVVDHVKKELDRIMFEEGQKLCHSVGVYNLPAPLVALLGRFKYRFSYGQNMIAHTLEETKIGIALAQEIGADVNTVRLGCLLHELLRKYGIPQKVIDCVAQHHEDTPFTSIESTIVYISDAISGSRPGARYEDHEEYIKRLTELETIAKAHKGVTEAFAFQAGREVRVVVDPGSIDDASATIIASEIKKEVEEKLTYPGQIKITVIRELRATEIAK
jgi:ribonucrease Y